MFGLNIWLQCGIFDLLVELTLRNRVEVSPVDEHLHEQGKKIEVFLGWRKHERIDGEAGRLDTDTDIGASEEFGQAFKTSTEIEDKGVRGVLLKIGEQEIPKKAFPSSRASENEGMGHITIVEVQEIRSSVIGFENGNRA